MKNGFSFFHFHFHFHFHSHFHNTFNYYIHSICLGTIATLSMSSCCELPRIEPWKVALAPQPRGPDPGLYPGRCFPCNIIAL